MKYRAAICAGECPRIENNGEEDNDSFEDRCFWWPRGMKYEFEASTREEAWAIANEHLEERWPFLRENLIKSGEWLEEMDKDGKYDDGDRCYSIYISEIGWGTETSESYKKLK